MVFGFAMNGALMVYLTLHYSSPGPLSATHAQAIDGTFITSCSQCHSPEGLTHGCLKCHIEIAEQVNQIQGYHGYLLFGGSRACQQCHPEHCGKEFPLISDLAWQDQDPATFNHPHVDFKLTGRHDGLTCAACHRDKLKIPYTPFTFRQQLQGKTYLGLSQDCVYCHEDIHEGDDVEPCDSCHDQEAFKPASHFRHDDYFPLVGAHAQSLCSTCHLSSAQGSSDRCYTTDANTVTMSFRLPRGKECWQCHSSPHRTCWDEDCQTCHFSTDLKWTQGQRRAGVQVHAKTGFVLDGIHANLACDSCHPSDRPYVERYPDPNSPDYVRQSDNCQGCHQNPHEGNAQARYENCSDCHDPKRFVPRWWQMEKTKVLPKSS